MSNYSWENKMLCILSFMSKIVEKYGVIQPSDTSTTYLADLLGISQQSVSRILIDLEKKDYISRTTNANGITLQFKPKSINILKSTYDILKKYFEDSSFNGKIVYGIGEGKYYVTHPQYIQLFKDKLNISNPFPGTLNVEVDVHSINFYRNIFHPIEINGFKTENRSFGSIECFKCVVNDCIPAWVLFAERTTHPENIIEIISEQKITGKENKIKITFIE